MNSSIAKLHRTRNAVTAFMIHGNLLQIVSFGSGHINDTYMATFNQAGTCVRYLLQRVNHQVFKNVPALMSNIERVCTHARSRLDSEGTTDVSRRALTVVPTHSGDPFHCDQDGNYWRVYLFIEDATGHDIIESPQQAYTAAYAFGHFQKLLSDLPGDRLHETVPDFHHALKRFAALELVLDADPHNRAASAKPEIDWVLRQRKLAGALLEMHAQGLIPERIAHNDAKLNNVLIDNKTQEAICVIDLDTLMPGIALFDFGDLVRTSTSPVAEDEADPSKVTMQLPMFDALVRGYLESAGDFLNITEIESLPLAGQVITLTIGIRFLTDYLQGDHYFRTNHPEHNLQRCRTQFALVNSMRRQEGAMQTCIHNVVG